jgi:galactose mutarotase-like enzyme
MRKYSKNNNNFQFSVKKKGAELCSFKSKKTNIEYIWKADSEVWSSHAPNLFPIIGTLKEDSFLFEGKEYACPKHGFIRNNDNIELISETENSLTFGLSYSDETLKIYPFKFDFKIRYELEANRLNVEYKISNLGKDTMFFSLGGHPGFTCPVHENEIYSDYYLEFEKPETAKTWRVLENGLIGKDTFSVFDESARIDLHPDIFDNDALVFKNLNSSSVSLKSKRSKQVVTFSFDDFTYLGIWAKPGAEFVCIEPWLGIADSNDSDRNFKHKEGIMKLDAKNSFKASYSIIIDE